MCPPHLQTVAALPLARPVSEMTYTVSNGTLNSTIPYLWQVQESGFLSLFNSNFEYADSIVRYS